MGRPADIPNSAIGKELQRNRAHRKTAQGDKTFYEIIGPKELAHKKEFPNKYWVQNGRLWMPGAIVRFVEYVKINPDTTAAKVEIIYTRKGSPPAKFVVLPYDWLVPRPEIQSIEDASGYIDKADIAVKK